MRTKKLRSTGLTGIAVLIMTVLLLGGRTEAYAASAKKTNQQAHELYAHALGSGKFAEMQYFYLIDINGDGVDEIAVTPNGGRVMSVYAYVSGEIKEIGDGFSGEQRYYPNKKLYYSIIRNYPAYESYYKFDGKSMKLVAQKYADNFSLEEPNGYTYQVNGKSASKSKYDNYAKKLLNGATEKKTKYVRNNASNRKKYLPSSSSAAWTTTKTALLKRIATISGENIRESFYSDFDNDGKKEIFVVTGAEEGPNKIWYAGSRRITQILSSGWVYSGTDQMCKVSARQKLFKFETGGGGSGSTSFCYYVKNGVPKKVAKSGEGLTHISGKNFVVYMSAFDGIKDVDGNLLGHTWKAYYLKWNGKKFVEYKGKKISLSKLKRYKGASSYINQVKKLGYKVGRIYYRSNGIINVNLEKTIKEGGYSSTSYENLTLKVSGKKVTLKVCYKSGGNLVEKSSYGGKYEASGF